MKVILGRLVPGDRYLPVGNSKRVRVNVNTILKALDKLKSEEYSLLSKALGTS